ncbi:hypothetical protein AAC387_Pa05g1948 [Persea americana]
MARGFSDLHLLLVLPLLLSFVFLSAQARPFNPLIMKQGNLDCEVVGFVEDLPVGALKTLGPSPPGKGHKLMEIYALGGIKDSGPSPPGEGH